MTPTTTVPFTITDEAMGYLRSLGLQAEFDRMVEHAKQVVPGLRKIHVRVQPPYDLGGPDAVLIEVLMADHCLRDEPTNWEWNEWMIQTFSPEVFQYFSLMPDYEDPKARGSKENRTIISTTGVPLTITEEVAEFVRDLGFQTTLERIVEQLTQVVPGLLSIDVRLMTMYDEGNAPLVNITCERLDRQLEDDPTQREWDDLFLANFPSEAQKYFWVSINFGGPDAR